MRVLLYVSASPRGAASHSRRIGQALIGQLRKAADLRVIERDLSSQPLLHPDRAFVEASLMAPAGRDARQTEALGLPETLIAELKAADLVVIATPMHNFTVPSVLKAWIDHVVRPGRTFRSTPSSKVGSVRDRPIFVVAACGPIADAAAGQEDFLTPYLRYVLGIVGLNNLSTLRLDSLNRGEAAMERAEASAASWILEKAGSLGAVQ